MYMYPLSKVTTELREFAAIQNVTKSQVDKILMNPTLALEKGDQLWEYFEQDPKFIDIQEKFFKQIQRKYNPTQAKIIKNICKQTTGISLLQGPPGTGKTHTLIGILSGLYLQTSKSEDNYKKRLMICAPSNAALDEIIHRIVQFGLIDENGLQVVPKLLRIGILDRNPSVIIKSVSLEQMAEAELIKQTKFSQVNIQNNNSGIEIRDQLEKVLAKIKYLGQDYEKNKIELQLLYDKRRKLYDDWICFKQNKSNQKEQYKDIIFRILQSSEIICCTLGSAGSDKLENFYNTIEAVIVDEASQCTETSNIIPLQYSMKKMILIGDPKQLPATTFSPDANHTLYNRSLFERFLDNGHKPYFLNIQYRMEPEIRRFPSKWFYDDQLLDDQSINYRKFSSCFSSFQTNKILFIDLPFSKEQCIDYSYLNKLEAKVAFELCKILIKKIKLQVDLAKTNIGFITPYKRQARYFQDLIKSSNSFQDYKKSLQINTVDSFQGQEKDLIIFSSVRANSRSTNKEYENKIGFLNDLRRMNVAITRAKQVLIVIGHAETLMTHETWNQYIKFFIENNYYMKIPNEEKISQIVNEIIRNPNAIQQYKNSTLNFTQLNDSNKNKLQKQNNNKNKINDNAFTEENIFLLKQKQEYIRQINSQTILENQKFVNEQEKKKQIHSNNFDEFKIKKIKLNNDSEKIIDCKQTPQPQKYINKSNESKQNKQLKESPQKIQNNQSNNFSENKEPLISLEQLVSKNKIKPKFHKSAKKQNGKFDVFDALV